jgi:hypothetical protein
MSKSKHLRAILIIVLVLTLGWISSFIFFQDDTSENLEPQDQNPSSVVESQNDEEESPEVSTSVEVVPETSPTENTNPFEDTYQNPFE